MEVAHTPTLRFDGLSRRSAIPPHTGMLFTYPDIRVRRYVMRHCWVPIDVVFLDSQGTIIALHSMPVEDPDGVVPENKLTRYSSGKPAQYALEFAQGSINMLELKQGQRITVPSSAILPVAQ
nr:DUF192 domain-containing protein [Echinimonas agarilytica]